jgi:hypothetical protein
MLENKWNLYGVALGLLGIAAGWVPVPAPLNYLGASLLVAGAIACFAWPHVRSRSAAPTVRDTWLQQAVFYIVHGRWLAENEKALTEDGQITEASSALAEMRQLARDGALSIWGKVSPPSTYGLIPPEYWANHQIDFVSIMRDEPEMTKTEKAAFEGTGPFYRNLMVSSAQIEALAATLRRRLEKQ